MKAEDIVRAVHENEARCPGYYMTLQKGEVYDAMLSAWSESPPAARGALKKVAARLRIDTSIMDACKEENEMSTETVSIETLDQVEERLERAWKANRLRQEDITILLKERVELAMLVRQLGTRLRKHEPEANTIQLASEYLGRHGLAGIPFRDNAP